MSEETTNDLEQANWKAPETGKSEIDIGPMILEFHENGENERNIYTVFHQSVDCLNDIARTGTVSYEQSQQSEEELAKSLEAMAVFTPDAFMSLLARLNQHVPPYFPLFLVATAPIERIGLNEAQKQSLGYMSIHWLKALSHTGQDLAKHYNNYVSTHMVSEGEFGTTELYSKVLQEAGLHSGVFASPHGGEMDYKGIFTGDREGFSFNISHFVILRALARRGILNFENYTTYEEREQVRPALTALIRTSLVGQALRVPTKNETRPNTYPIPTKLPIHTAVGRSTQNNSQIGDLRLTPAYDGKPDNLLSRLPMLSIGWFVMRDNDYRINWHYKDQAEADEIATKLAPIVVDCLYEGIPLSIKSTYPDPDSKEYQGRYLFYTDAMSADKVLRRLASQFPPLPSMAEENEDVKLYPFGSDVPVHIRTTHEGGNINREVVKKDFVNLVKGFLVQG